MGVTKSANSQTVKRIWRKIDAADQVLGRLASQVAFILRGKDKPEFTPHADTGDYVVITNAEKIRVTGNKVRSKLYYYHTNYTGSLKTKNFAKLLEEKPTEIIIKAVKGMLPKGPLGYAMLKKLKVYVGDAHPHAAQEPKEFSLESKN